MQKKLAALAVIASLIEASAAFATATQLRDRHPFGVLGLDYGVLNEGDIKENERRGTPVPFSTNTKSTYSYWQCFPAKHVVVICEPTFSRSPPHAYLVLETRDLPSNDSYLGRDARDEKDCLKLLTQWDREIKKSRFVCVSGIFNGTSDGGKTRDWVFDRFKTDRTRESVW